MSREREIRIGPVLRVVIGFVVIGAAIQVGVWWMYRYFRAQDQARNVQRVLVDVQPPVPPEPRLQVNPQEDLQAYRREQQQILTSYGWVSRPEGKVRIPVERAMQLVVDGR